ncbi:MAG TPA: surface-adhesin E family protein [Steroidobacteraceae bacterium]|nr:surface-adhesin E family protein [Steroidobacteraceae bacterium]
MKRRIRALLVPALLAALPAAAQITTVPMKGAGNEWVKALDLRGRMDWEWIETYPEQVYFATSHDSARKGDIVTMWTRVEYKHPQNPLAHKSALSKDDWDCKSRARSTSGVFFYKWNNLQTDRETPERSTNLLRSWEKIEKGTIGETLLNFACGIRNVTPVIKDPEPSDR